jgi:5-fold beta-flower protein
VRRNNRAEPRFIFFSANLLLACLLLAQELAASEQNRQVRPQGNVLNLYGAPVGAVDENGNVFNAYRSKLGRVDSDGNVYNVSEIFIGKVGSNGDLFNQEGVFIGYVRADGSVYNVSDIKIGSVQTGGNLILSGAAARIIFFRGSNTMMIPRPFPKR